MATAGCAGIPAADTFCGPVAALPQAGELLQLDDMPVSAGGCAANVAIDLARQGMEASGCIGNDAAGESLFWNCSAGITRGRVVRTAEFPTSKTVVLRCPARIAAISTIGAKCCLRRRRHRSRLGWSLRVLYIGGLFALPHVDERAHVAAGGIAARPASSPSSMSSVPRGRCRAGAL